MNMPDELHATPCQCEKGVDGFHPIAAAQGVADSSAAAAALWQPFAEILRASDR